MTKGGTVPTAAVRLPLAVALLAPLAAGCQGLQRVQDRAYTAARSLITSSYHDPAAEDKLVKADELFRTGKYADAQDIYSDLAENTRNPVLLAEKARYFEAECQRERGRLAEAVATYHRMLQDCPMGVYKERACGRMYDIARGWLKTDTLDRIAAEQAGTAPPWYADLHTRLPDPLDRSRPLLDAEGESLQALEHVNTYDPLGPNADKALYTLGYVHFYRGRFEEADDYFSQLVDMHKQSPLRAEALKLAIMAKNNSTGGAVYDSTKASEALQLVRHAEATEAEYAKDDGLRQFLTRSKMAVHVQLAQKEYERGRYYERVNHPASAYFVYHEVCRKYAGTKYSDLAQARIAALKELQPKLEAEREAAKSSTWGKVRREWDRVTGGPVDLAPDAPADPVPGSAPAAAPVVPANVQGDTTGSGRN
jgi:tetratricopeptide (TPR) repeat protein